MFPLARRCNYSLVKVSETLKLFELLSGYKSQSINEKYILSVVSLGSLSNYKHFLLLESR